MVSGVLFFFSLFGSILVLVQDTDHLCLCSVLFNYFCKYYHINANKSYLFFSFSVLFIQQIRGYTIGIVRKGITDASGIASNSARHSSDATQVM